MTDTAPEIQRIPVTSITVLNPRLRGKRGYRELVASIAALGLKKPVTVRKRPNGTGFDLVCGQGRLEAFKELGGIEIPAIIVDATEEDCFVMSLVENLARRHHTPMELIQSIITLRERGHSQTEIAARTGFSYEYIKSIFYLVDHGENRLLVAVEKGIIPHTVAMEIVRAREGDVQTALLEAYESKKLPGNQVVALRKIIDQRRLLGKGLTQLSGLNVGAKKVSADVLVKSYMRQAEQQKSFVRKAEIAQRRLLFMANALRRLHADEHFSNLLRAEGIPTMPRQLSERVAATASRP